MSDDYIPLVLSSDDDEIIEIMQTPPTPRPEARPSRVLPPSTRLQIQINGVRDAISELDGYIERARRLANRQRRRLSYLQNELRNVLHYDLGSRPRTTRSTIHSVRERSRSPIRTRSINFSLSSPSNDRPLRTRLRSPPSTARMSTSRNSRSLRNNEMIREFSPLRDDDDDDDYAYENPTAELKYDYSMNGFLTITCRDSTVVFNQSQDSSEEICSLCRETTQFLASSSKKVYTTPCDHFCCETCLITFFNLWDQVSTQKCFCCRRVLLHPPFDLEADE
jgi:hypothetical protein